MTNALSTCLHATILFAACAIGACDGTEDSFQAPVQADTADAASGDSGGPPGTLDRGKLGKACRNSGDCENRRGCYEFGSVEPPVEGAHCVDVANGCEVLTCTAGFKCVATGGDPGGVACAKQQR